MEFDASKILLYVFWLCLIIGALDSFRGNVWHLGERFNAGIRAFEPLFLTMAGILVLTPFLRLVLAPILTPFFSFFGIDPSVFAGLFLACDMGAFPLAHSLSANKAAADFSGMLLGSVLGVNLVFTLPAALKIIPKEDHCYLFKGMLLGFITVPIGCFFGGMLSGCQPIVLLAMLIPVVLVSILSALMLWLIPKKLSVILSKLGRVIEAVALIGIILAILCEFTGISSHGFLDPIQAGISVVGSIIIVLPGAYVFIALLDRGCHPVFIRIGKILGINETAVLGLFTTLANSIPTFMIIKDMDPKGKTMNCAFLTAGAFAFGDHLAYCYAVAPKLTVALLATKLVAAVSSVFLLIVLNHLAHILKKENA